MTVDFGRLDSLSPLTLSSWERVLNDETVYYAVRTRINWYGERRIEILEREGEVLLGSFSIYAVACKIRELSGQYIGEYSSRNSGNAVALRVQQFHNDTKAALKSENCFVQLLAWLRSECIVPKFLELILGNEPASPFTIHARVHDKTQKLCYETKAGALYTKSAHRYQGFRVQAIPK